MEILLTTKPAKRLHFDIENRPLSYWYDGNCTAEITAIAASWSDSDEIFCWVLPDTDAVTMLEEFLDLYDQADTVTGHYIRRHDLPILNGACLEAGLLPLLPKHTIDTKMDLTRTGGLSMSQEALSAMMHLDQPKHHMTQEDWRTANRLTRDGVYRTKKRVVSDVIQHKELFEGLVPYLKKGKIWQP